MKITRAQKDAVISLLKEKFNEKQEEVNKKYYEANKEAIHNEFDKYKALYDRYAHIAELIEDVKSDFKEFVENSKYLTDKIHVYFSLDNNNVRSSNKCCVYDGYNTRGNIERNPQKIVVYPKIETPDFEKVERQLELDTLSKDFNLDKFIEKYLDN